MRFQVPQYIDIEDKIFGPFTFKQFVYIGGGAGLSFIIYFFFDSLFFALIFIIPLMMFSGLLAFYKYNSKPFVFLLESLFYYSIGNKLFIWKKEKQKPSKTKKNKEENPSIADDPIVTRSNLHNLSWKLDMKEKEEKVSDRF